jgi:hypothetical protein
MRKYSHTFGPPYYTFFHGKNALGAIAKLKAENQKIMDIYMKEHADDTTENPSFWRVVTGIDEGEGSTLLCILE